MAARGVEGVALGLRGDVVVVVVLPLSAGVPHERGVVAPVQAPPMMQHCVGGGGYFTFSKTGGRRWGDEGVQNKVGYDRM